MLVHTAAVMLRLLVEIGQNDHVWLLNKEDNRRYLFITNFDWKIIQKYPKDLYTMGRMVLFNSV